MALFEPGARVWFKVQDLWVPATAVSNTPTDAVFRGDDGQTLPIPVAQINTETVTPMHVSSQKGTEDMATLADLHTGAILYNIHQRYKASSIYTYIGSILAAVNPYKDLPGLYDDSRIVQYKDQALGSLPPHIYAIANETYTAMWKSDQNQVVLISGESGAGKTESTKFILRYLSFVSNEATGKGDGKHNFEEQILRSSPILEAFGNAKTVYNNNSSRFGKFVKISFSSAGSIEGGKIIDYLLEKNRVVRLNPGERNFHIFYCLVSGRPDPSLQLTSKPTDYHYLNQGKVIADPAINDAADWQRVLQAFDILGFTKQQKQDVLTVLAAILNLGQVNFIQAGGAQVKEDAVVATVASLLQVDGQTLSEVLTQTTRTLRGEVITTPMEIPQALDSRDSLAMALYACLFKWLIKKINATLAGADTFHSVGVLDIFGFENFEINSFEQFNINYANEKLQQYFNRHIFALEQLEYNREGIAWTEIDWVDNAECLDLIERKLGVLSLVDEEARFPQGTDASLLIKLHQGNGGKTEFYIRPRVANTKFGIKHYAGEVMYDITGFIDKNRDSFREDLYDMLQNSSNDFVFDLFEHMEVASTKGDSKSTARKKATVMLQFKESLASLMNTLGSASPFFVRCIKPNMKKVQDRFDSDVVLNQLRYSGMLETVRIRRAGFPVRRAFSDFLFRYRVLGQGLDRKLEGKDRCGGVLARFDSTKKHWQLGINKVFLREALEVVLEQRRTEALKQTMAKIHRVMARWIERQRYLARRRAIIRIQAWFKPFFYRARFLKARTASVKIQCAWRCCRARRELAVLREQKRIEDERRREEERRREAARLAELKRLEELAKQAAAKEAKEAEEAARKLAEARAQAEAEAKAKAAEEARKKAQDEQQMRDAMEKAKRLDEEHRVAEEAAKREAEEAKRLMEEAKRLKELEEARRLAAIEAQKEQARADAEMEAERKREEVETRMEEDEEAAGEEEPLSEYREGYLGMYRGMLKNLKKRWCVLHDGTFMCFKGRQNFIKAGWLTKMGGGTSTLGRKNWKRRWFTLKGGELHYHPGEDDDSEVLGIIDVQNCEEINSGTEEDLPVKKDNALAIKTHKRTYFMYADTPEEAAEWFTVLQSVKGKTDVELREMMASASVDPRNAQMTFELEDILSVGPANRTDVDGHPVFVVICADRVEKFVAADQDDLDEWVRVLSPKKGKSLLPGAADEATERGWMLKMGGKANNFKRRRWFVLRDNVLSYYKNPGDDFTVGSIILNSLCSVIPPDEATAAAKNDWTFIVHAKRKSYHLTCKTQADCNRWINALQDVIDNSPAMETDTELLIDRLKMASPAEVDQIYSTKEVLSYSPAPLKGPLLPLPYGETTVTSGRTYDTLQEEAVKISTSLLPPDPARGQGIVRYGSPADPIPLIKRVCQACFDVQKLRNEVYCQAIKLTTNASQPGSPLNMTHWHLLGALCSSFAPARKFARFLRFHLRRTMDMPEAVGDEVVQAATLCLEALRHVKTREFPPSTEEIKGIMSGKGLMCVVHCVGGRELTLPITSSTTCGEVIVLVKKELQLAQCRNGFGLFESCGTVDKYLEEKYAVSDVLSKWEKYAAHGLSPEAGGAWQLVFKLFSFYDPRNPRLSKIEQEFLFEQAFESVMQRRFPADDDMLVHLAALRLQYVVGDYEDGAYVSDVVKVHPAQQAQLLAGDSSGALGTLKKAGTLFKGTLRGLGSATLRKLKGSVSSGSGSGSTMKRTSSGSQLTDAEMAKVKEEIAEVWATLKGKSKDEARVAYMEIVQQWKGYGANLFEVEQVSDKSWPKELWLAISLEGVTIYPRGEREPLASYPYQAVLSFGAPVANRYKIMVDNVGSMLFETNMVLEIAKLMKEYIKEIVTRRK